MILLIIGMMSLTIMLGCMMSLLIRPPKIWEDKRIEWMGVSSIVCMISGITSLMIGSLI